MSWLFGYFWSTPVLAEEPMNKEIKTEVVKKTIILDEDILKTKNTLKKPAERKQSLRFEIQDAKSRLLVTTEQKQIEKVIIVPEFVTCRQNLRKAPKAMKKKDSEQKNPLFTELFSKCEEKKVAKLDVLSEKRIALLTKIQETLLEQKKVEIFIRHYKSNKFEEEYDCDCLNYGYSEKNLLPKYADSTPLPIVYIELKHASHYAKDKERYFEKNKIRVFYGLDVYKRTHPYQMFLYLSDFVSMLLAKKLPQTKFLDYWGCDGEHCNVAAQIMDFFMN